MQLWIVGKFKNDSREDKWELQGVFTSEAKARVECVSADHFIDQIEADKPFPRETVKIVPERPWAPNDGRPRQLIKD